MKSYFGFKKMFILGHLAGALLIMSICYSFMVNVALAEDAKATVPAMSAEDLKKALGMSIYLQGGYTGNFNSPASQENDLRVFDHKADSFTIDLAQIRLQKDPALGNVGYKLKLSTGETAKWIHSRGLSGAPLSSSQVGDGTDPLDLTEAYVSYNAALGRGLRFDFGKMVTYFGAEVIEAQDNPNYSRSFLFNYAIPFTHTGLKISYPFTDALTAALHISNGWDNSNDNNKDKSYGLSIGFAPAEAFSASFNAMYGPEQDNNTSNKRILYDIVATIKPIKKLALILNADSGQEENVITTGTAKWVGVAGIVKYDFSDRYSLAIRGEIFDDKDGFRTGTVQRLSEITVTPEIRLNGGVVLRPEYRHDSSDQTFFNGGQKKDQDTLALGVMYTW
jgi:hypothetical protein